ncbi:sensor histidine kinase [Streptomyces sp. NPDC056930]|uniref:sensor histidine kinase n=1 Tax=Streptomyces sp. NPDC056930 TaxID=3345967 RepID=UPI003643AE81
MRGPTTVWPGAVPGRSRAAGTVYRIVQESLTNIVRHASHARSATVDIAQDPVCVTVRITDDAPPGHTRHLQKSGFGLIGMQERVEALGGTLTVGPCPEPAGQCSRRCRSS